MDISIFPLPFGLILKEDPRVREQEGIAMNLARAMGVPAPRCIAFGEPPPWCKDRSSMPSLLMTRIPGIELGNLRDEEVNFDVIKDDLWQGIRG